MKPITGVINIVHSYNYCSFTIGVDCYINNDPNMIYLSIEQLQEYIKEGYIVNNTEKRNKKKYVRSYLLQKSAYYVEKSLLNSDNDNEVRDYMFYVINDGQSVKNEELMNICRSDVEDKLHTRKMNVYKYPGRNNYGIPLYELEEIIKENRLSFEKYEKIGDNSPEFVCKMHREYDNDRDYYIFSDLKYPGCEDAKMTEVFEKNILPYIQNWFHSKERRLISALDAANYFLSLSSMEHRKLQGMCYYAQAWSLALYGRRLIDTAFEAWVHGPTSVALFDRYGDWEKIPIPRNNNIPEFLKHDSETTQFLTDIFNIYKDYSAEDMEKLSKQEKPWQEARGSYPSEIACREVIREDVMRSFYEELLNAKNKKTAIDMDEETKEEMDR